MLAPVKLRMCYVRDGKLTVKAEYKIKKEGDEETIEQSFEKLPAILPTPVGVFSFTTHDSIPVLEDDEMRLVAQRQSRLDHRPTWKPVTLSAFNTSELKWTDDIFTPPLIPNLS